MIDCKKILIIDDSITILEVVKKFISNKNYEIVTANNGLSGLKIAQSEKPDIVLLDIMLPKMDGYKVCREIKNDTSLSKTKVVLFSVKTDKESENLGRAAGADDFISKNIGLDKISSIVDNLLKS